ncbi:MAG: D-alanine--D-alanine ligase [Solobacterium sp.]|nr:D-alanine--D-alanine ligase [Solobacterium sp.]MBQ9825151.1 D-alanine--D-alanine ligase [Solobacterium sp.]
MKLNVAVFFGGESVEHEVSVISAHQAMDALTPDKYNVIPVYVSKDRRLFTSEKMGDIQFFTGRKLDEVIAECTQIYIVRENNKAVIRPVRTKMFGSKEIGTIDVAVPVMHGTNGEDGTIQGYLEMLKVPYAGCDLYGAAVGQDKVLMKHILADNGLPMADWFWVYGREIDDHPEEVLAKARKLKYPVILKPARTGSSVGIAIAHNDEEYLECFEDARQYDEKVITEKVIRPMREINCSVLGDGYESETSVLEEVSSASKDELLNFKDKYQGGGKAAKGAKTSGSKGAGMASTSRIVPAPLSEAETEHICSLAKKTFAALGAAGVCRIDFMMDAETKHVYVNEINTIPGSLAFYLWTAKGVSFPELMDRLVNLALERERRRSRMTTSFDTDLLLNYKAGGGAKGAKGSKG